MQQTEFLSLTFVVILLECRLFSFGCRTKRQAYCKILFGDDEIYRKGYCACSWSLDFAPFDVS